MFLPSGRELCLHLNADHAWPNKPCPKNLDMKVELVGTAPTASITQQIGLGKCLWAKNRMGTFIMGEVSNQPPTPKDLALCISGGEAIFRGFNGSNWNVKSDLCGVLSFQPYKKLTGSQRLWYLHRETVARLGPNRFKCSKDEQKGKATTRFIEDSCRPKSVQPQRYHAH